MNVAQAKEIHLRDLLENLGHTPQRVVSGECWYLSPFRQEADASFKITRDGKAWYDHGGAEGGTIIEFVIRYYGLGQNDVAGALQMLRSLRLGGVQRDNRPLDQPSLLHEGLKEATETPDSANTAAQTPPVPMTVRKIQPLQNPALKQYLQKRCIDVEIAAQYLQEIYYQRNEKNYFALAFANASGGYELRNPYFQGTFGTKDITVLLAGDVGSGSSVAIFEGVMDFLSALTYRGKKRPDGMAIVLNSAAMRERALRVVEEAQIATLYLYLDHDDTGRTLTMWFQEQLTNHVVEDKAAFYADFKDVNEWLMAQGRSLSH